MKGLLITLAVLVLVAVVLVGWIVYKVRRFFTALKTAFCGTEAPKSVTLVPIPRASWKDSRAVKGAADALHRGGFTEAGAYKVDEIKNLVLQAFVAPAAKLYGVLYEMEGQGVWMDVCAMGEGCSLTVSNAPMGQELDQRPGHEKVWMTGKAAADVVAEGLRRTAGGPWNPATPEAFKQMFERAYREHMQWIEDRGGPTDEEIERVALRSGLPATEEGKAAVRAQWQREDESPSTAQ